LLSVLDGQIEKKLFVFWIERARGIHRSREMSFPQPKASLPRKENLLEKQSPKVLPSGNAAGKGAGNLRFYPRELPTLHAKLARKKVR
jgi:hypothetical protein